MSGMYATVALILPSAESSVLLASGPKVIGRLGPLTLYLFGLTVAAGCIVGVIVAMMQARRFGLSATQLFEATAPSLIAAVVSARLAYVIVNFPDYRPALAAVWHFSEGGFAFYGGLAGGIAVAALYASRLGLPVGRLLDAAAPGLALGQAVGFVGAHVIGRETSVPWAVYVDGQALHPFPAYAIVFAYGLFFFLWRLGERPTPMRPGHLFLVYALLHGWGTAVVGTWAAGSRYGGMTAGQWAGLILGIVVGIALLMTRSPGTDGYTRARSGTGAETATGIGVRSALQSVIVMSVRRRRLWYERIARAATWLAGLAALLILFSVRM